MSRRREIVRRATEVFERKGVAATSIGDIAEAVGVKREAIYYYFKSRADILLEIILPHSAALLRGLETVMRANMSNREKLRAAIRNHLETFNPHYLEMSVALRERHVFRDEAKADELRDIWRRYNELWVELVRDGQASGEFESGPDSKVVAFGILGMCNWLSRWYDPDGKVSIPEISDIYAGLLVRGLAAPDLPAAAE